MSSIFTNTFGGSPVSPSDVSFASYVFGANLTLFWPAFSAGQTDVVARFMNMDATTAGLEVFMPQADLVSVGYDVVIFNNGMNTFDVVSSTGVAIVTIAPNTAIYILLNDNATETGMWQTVQFGAGTAAASAAALAGAGLIALSGKLNVNYTTTEVSSSTTLTSGARAVLQVWTGGSGTITLPSSAAAGNGFFFPFNNDGTGSVVFSPVGGDLIDGASSSTFTQTQSGFIVSSGTGWHTVGKGTQNNFVITLLNLNVTGGADITETSAQAQNIIQQFTGVLSANINVIVPATVQIYYVFNNTSGAHTLTVKTASGTGITVDQGSHIILYCDGTNVVNAFTSSFGGGISISAGSATSPNLNFTGSPSTGIYSPTTNQFAITAGGKEVMNFTADTSAVNWFEAHASATGAAISLSAHSSTDTNVSINITPLGAGSVGITKALVTGGTIDGTIIGSITPAAVTGTTITATSFIGPLTGNVVGNVTGNVSGSSGSTTGNAATATALQTARTINGVSFDGTANITVTAAAGTLTGTTLNSTITASSLTSVGTLATLTVTAPIVGSINGNAATVTTNANLTGDVTSVGNATTIKTNVALAGSPTTTTQSPGDNTTKISTTAFVTAAVSAATAIKVIRIQQFTSSGTYTPNANMLQCYTIAQGGGGGGGGGTASGANSGGGGAGGRSEAILTAAQIGASKAVTVGAAGTGGITSGGGTGNSGGTSSLGTLVVAGGGAGGIGSAGAGTVLGGVGGTATTGDLLIPGQAGGRSIPTTPSISGYGGSGLYGAGAAGVSGSNVVGANGTGHGSGGSGCSGNVNGGDGTAGYVIIYEYCSA